jgi:hypothetical protein
MPDNRRPRGLEGFDPIQADPSVVFIEPSIEELTMESGQRV